MKGRFGTPLWVIPVLAMVMAVGAFAVFAGINQFSAHPAEASIQEAGPGLSANADLEKLSEPLKTPLQPATQVATATAVNNPDRPGVVATYTFTFTAPDVLNNGADQVIFTFDEEFGVPNTLDRNQVSIRASAVTQGGTAGQTVAPDEVSRDLVGPGNDQPEIRLRVPDMDTSDTTGAGGQGIAQGAIVTVQFRQAAGIRNPTEGGTDPINIRVTSNGADPGAGANELVNAGAGLSTPLIIEMSSDDGARGDEVTLVGRGFRNGTTTTYWLDVNGDGLRGAGERDLCSAPTANDDTATCTFSVSNPPFMPGFTAVGGNCRFPITASFNCNYINGIDGRSITASQRDQADVNRTRFELEPTLTVSPTTSNVGDRVTISLFDYPAGGVVDLINLGGVAITGNTTPSLGSLVSGLNAIPTSGQESFTLTVPGNVTDQGATAPTRIPTGVQEIEVFTNFGTPTEAAQDVNLTLGGANLSISHQVVLANQDLTISGDGFSERGAGNVICVLENDITLNNVQLRIDSDSQDPSCANQFPDRRGVELSSGGTFTATVNVVDTLGNIDVALVTAGTHELKVIDSSGAEATLQVTVPERTMEVTPGSARPRDIVTIIGRNFPADNPDTGSVPVEVLYDCGGNNTRQLTADPDVSGNFRETLRIPTNCAIPSTNTITATLGASNVTETSVHQIPDALVRVEPLLGRSGDTVTVRGEGFRTFETVESIEFGGRGTLGGRTVNTDANGNFAVTDVVVPGLDPGVHAVIVGVGAQTNRVTSSTSFEVVPQGFAGAITSDSEEVFGDIPSLERAWLFDNTDKEWRFFDTRQEFTELNSLMQVPSGAPVWLSVTENTQAELNGQQLNLTCVNPGTPEEDCWNLIVFP